MQQRPMLLIVLVAAAVANLPTAHAGRAADCAARADRASRNSGTVIGGAARGAVRGAIVGSIVGDSRKSKRRGARLGAIAGTARTAQRKNNAYERVYDDCMAGY